VIIVAPLFCTWREDDLFVGVSGGDIEANEAAFRRGVDIFFAVEGDEFVFSEEGDL